MTTSQVERRRAVRRLWKVLAAILLPGLGILVVMAAGGAFGDPTAAVIVLVAAVLAGAAAGYVPFALLLWVAQRRLRAGTARSARRVATPAWVIPLAGAAGTALGFTVPVSFGAFHVAVGGAAGLLVGIGVAGTCHMPE